MAFHLTLGGRRLAIAAGVVALLAGWPSVASGAGDLPAPSSGIGLAITDRPACPVPAGDTARCLLRVRTDLRARQAHPMASGQRGARPNGTVGNGGGYDPSYLQSAYNLPSQSGGTGEVVAIVDAYDDPTAESDLAYYRSYYGLPACTSVTGCFRKVNEYGQPAPQPTADSSWSQEISADLDMVSAVCPNCGLLLVETNTSSYRDLAMGVNAAASLGANVVNNSYGGPEWNGDTQFDGYYNHPGVAVVASAGDGGYGVDYPAASPYVTAVAGTTLNQSSNSGSRAATETVWNSTGSGCSAYDPKPTWQTDPGCANRTVADTAAVADPGTGVWVYYNGGWSIDGGTSISSAVIAGVYGLADGASAASLYADPTALNDVTSGSNGSCGSYLCAAGAGYDGPSGLGSPNGIAAFESTASAAPAPGYRVTASPSTAAVQPGASASYTLTLTAVGGYTSPVFLTAGGLPSGGIASFAPNPVTPTAGGTTSTLSVATSSSTAMGSYPITITAYGANASLTVRRTTVTLTVATVPTFSIAASPPSASVSGAGGASYSVSLTASGGYSSPVTLSASGLPAGASASFAPNPVTPSASGAPSSMKVSTSANTPAGSYTLSISGNDSSGSSRTTTVVLVVKGDYSLAVSPSSLSIRRGQSGAASVAVNTGDGYSSNVTLSVAGLPKHASASFSPNPVAPGSSGQLAISAGAPTSTGSYTLTVSGQGADGTSRSTTMVLSIR